MAKTKKSLLTNWLFIRTIKFMVNKDINFATKQPGEMAVFNKNKIAILCAQRKSIYNKLSIFIANNQYYELEIYDKKRDARTYATGMAVIAHPPCRLWGNLAHTNKLNLTQITEEKELGRFCARSVIDNGGILEQPFDSELFPEMNLPTGGMANELGFTLEVPQRMFGHEMIKNTWLFFSKIKYENIEPIMPAIHGKPLKQIYNLSHKQRNKTPGTMAIWLLKNVINVIN